jgi:DNA-binding transcriptional ArsR family regulator
VLCEECYLLAAHRVQACDPLAVRSAQSARKAFGISPLEGLTAQQRAIREYIAAKGRAAAGELERELGIPPAELHNDLAVLRHCELVKGQKEGGTVYLVLY